MDVVPVVLSMMAATPPATPAPIDHLVYHAPEPERTREEWAKATGIEPAFGGAHTQGGTANWVAALGGGAYLELLGPVPGMPPAGARADFIVAGGAELFNFAITVEDAAAFAARLSEAGVRVDGPVDGGRDLPDGTSLRWRTVAVLDSEFCAYVPFAIQWMEGSAHPATSAPAGLGLRELSVSHPQAARLNDLYEYMGLQLKATRAPEPRMQATIEGPAGQMVLARVNPPCHGY